MMDSFNLHHLLKNFIINTISVRLDVTRVPVNQALRWFKQEEYHEIEFEVCVCVCLRACTILLSLHRFPPSTEMLVFFLFVKL